MKKKYEIAVLLGTVYTVEIEAENLEEALEIAEDFDPHHRGADAPEWDEVESDRTIIIDHSHGATAFGFGVETAIMGSHNEISGLRS
jgi:hypothetical protein